MGLAPRNEPRRGRRGAVLLAGLLMMAAWLPGAASAGNFQVNPVVVEILPGRRTATIAVTNRGGEPVPVRVTIHRWTQQDGEDVYTPVTELIASPPMFTIPANGTQHVRVGPRAQAAPGAYRVIVEEIPRSVAGHNGVNIALRLNLPLYIYAERGGEPRLSWSAWRNSAGEFIVEARNSGTRHSQIVGIDLVDASGRATPLSSQMGVVLPGGAKRWKAAGSSGLAIGENVQLSIRSASGETRHNVVLESR